MQDKESKTWGTLAKKEDIERDRARCGSISFCCGCSSSSSSLGMVLPDVDIVDPLLSAGGTSKRDNHGKPYYVADFAVVKG
eukprot:scaffold37781_cov198-Skeletonema_marinoi.AAC.7